MPRSPAPTTVSAPTLDDENAETLLKVTPSASYARPISNINKSSSCSMLISTEIRPCGFS